MTGVPSDMRGSGGVTRGTGRSPGGGVIGFAGGGVGGECGGAHLAHPDLATRPGTTCFEGFAGPVVFRVLLLEERKHAFGAVRGPEHQ